MKTVRLSACLIFVASLLGAICVRAQSPAVGSVEGRVKNAATGTYLNNARVTVKGTNLVTFTDEGGNFRLAGIPSGAVTLRAFFTGLDEKEIALTVLAGQVAQQDIDLTNKSLYGETSDTVKLDQFVVQSTRETNAAAIAINEQRFSANIKSVVSTDAFGPQANHNVGEFLKWLPGVGVEYFANNITGVNVRGLGAMNTEITFDGVRQASSFTESNSRAFEMKESSIADIARAEIRMMPLPEDSANAIGGSINLIRRSAFEKSRAILTYQAYFTSDGEVLTTQERDGPKDRKMQYWRPNFQFTYTNPVSKTFGYAISLSHDDKIVRTHWSQPGFNYGSTASNLAYEQAKAAGAAANDPRLTAPSVYNPANQTQLLHDAPIKDTTELATIKVDWKPGPELTVNQVVSFERYLNQTADDVRYTWTTGAALYADQNKVLGSPGTGSAKFNTPLWRDQYNYTRTYQAQAKWRHNLWTVNATGAFSYSSHSFADTKDGFFNSTTAGGNSAFLDTGVGTGTANPISATFNFYDWNGKMFQRIEAFTTATGLASTNAADYNVPLDWTKAGNMRIGGVRSKPSKDYTTTIPLRFYAKRDFDLRENPASLQVGFDFTEEYRNRQRYDNKNWKFVGADHVAGTADDTAAAIVADSIRPDRDSFYNSPAFEHISLSKLYSIYQAHPDYFVYDDINSWKLSAQQPMEYDEKTYAPYLQGAIKLLHNRLSLVGGVRFERATVTGRGFINNPEAAYQKYADGKTPKNTADLLNADGTPQRYSDGSVKRTGDVLNADGSVKTHAAGTFVNLVDAPKGSFAEAVLQNTPKGASGSGSNQNYFPSLHATFNLTDNLIWKAAAGKTQAKNRFDRSVIPNTTVSDTADTAVTNANLGSVTVRNPNLKPWVAYSYETALEYYTNSGGSLKVDGYMRSIHNYQVNPSVFLDSATTAAQFGLGPEFVNYTAKTWVNIGSVKIVGAEASIQQRFDPFVPDWAKGFSASLTYNYNNEKGEVPTSNGDFGNLYDDRETAHLSFSRSLFGKSFHANVGYIRTGRIWVQADPTNGHNGTREYVPVGLFDASIQVGLTKWLALYISGSDLTNEAKTRVRRIDGAPAWSRLQIENSLGKTYSIGVTGEF